MPKPKVQRLMTEARDCALIMMDNAGYIQSELANVKMPDALRTRTEQLCEDLVGTKHDVISELFRLDELLDQETSASDVVARLISTMARTRSAQRWRAGTQAEPATRVLEVSGQGGRKWI